MKKTSKVISLRQRKIEKRYKNIIDKKNLLILFLGVPILISSILVIDNYFVKIKLEKKGVEYNPYANVNLNYINEAESTTYKDIKRYYMYKDKIKDYMGI